MKKTIAFYILLLFSSGLFGSVTLLMRHHDASPASQITVPVKVKDFLNIISVQGTIQFDQTISAFVSVQDFGLSGMNASSFGTTQTGSGKLTFSWFDASLIGVTLPDTAIIFSVKFNVIGSLNQVSTLTFVNAPTIMEVINNTFGTETLILENGAVHVQNTVIPANVTLKIDTISGTNGSQVLISLRGTDFININSIQGTIQFDPAVVSYGGIGYYGLSGLTSSNFGTTQISSGKLTFSWVDATLSGQDMTDNSPLFTIIFNLTGNAGEQSILSFATSPTPLEVTDSLLNTLTVNTVNGNINITGSTVIQTLTLFGDSVAGAPSTQIVVPFRANNFNKIISMQGTLDFNTNIITYAGVEQFGLPDMGASNFGTAQTATGKLTFSWYDQTLTGQSVSDSSILFAVRYNVVGSIGQNTDINFVNSPTPVEVIDTSYNPVNTALYHGHAEILDLQGVSVSSISNDTLCVGDSIMIPFIKWGPFNSGNIFTAQLSDSAGSFTNPVNIGNLITDTTGVIHAFIPLNSVQGTQYKIRIIASDPAYTGNPFSGDIGIFTYPVADAGADTSVCFGNSITLTAGGGTFYHWSENSYTQSISVTPGTTSGYYVTVTNGAVCSSIDSVLVTVNSLPDGQVSNDTTICNGNPVMINATGGINYVWSNGVYNADNNVSPLNDTQYLVTISDVNLCYDIDTVTVSVITVPADAGINQTICTGDSVTLTATGGNSYIWSNDSITDVLNISPDSTTIYFVTVTDLQNCSANDSVTIYVNPLPVADAGNDTALCYGNSVTLNASGAVQYLWNNGVNTSINTVSPVNTTSYIVTVTDLNNCFNIDTITVTVNSLPVAFISNDTAVCINEPVNLIAGGGSSYLWSNNEVTNFITVTPAITSVFFVTVTDTNGCSDTADVLITINNASADAGADVNLCAGDTVVLSASGGISYQWSTGDNTQSIEVSPMNQIIFYVTITSAESCIAHDSVTVFVLQVPLADAGNDTAVCKGNFAFLNATGGVYYQWNIGINSQSVNVSADSTTVYYVTVTDIFSCSSFDSVTVIINPLPNIFAGNDTSICSGTTAGLSASGGLYYSWNNGDTTQSISVNPLLNTDYIVTGTDNNNCVNSDTVTVFVNIVNAFAGNDTSVCYGNSITLSANGGLLYEWNNGVNTSSNNVSPLVTTTYSVVVTDINNCSNSDSVVVTVNSLPVVNLGSDTLNTDLPVVLDAGSGNSSFIWSTGETTQIITANAYGWYFVTVIDVNDCSVNDSIYVDIFVNTQDYYNMHNWVKIFPNPVHEFLYVICENKQKPSIVIITDINGKIILKKNIFNISNKLDLINLLPGCYNITVFTDNKVYMEQIIKL